MNYWLNKCNVLSEGLSMYYKYQLIQGENLSINGNIISGCLLHQSILQGSVVICIDNNYLTFNIEGYSIHNNNMNVKSASIDYKTNEIKIELANVPLTATAEYEFEFNR